ncbi:MULTISPECIES: tetratricopeptide repeat protein [Flavobacterium]|uniref:tetratricopeptide repeat protein n=1 Tax=Flavobacterium TaxID=237 RepID=UPI001FCBB67E|nr:MULTISPECIES: tetratricopeptide repeat protein [Flavobacterium]UOK43862.1 tetratricopeptide repeat protein [Flavobacterium enshiense]
MATYNKRGYKAPKPKDEAVVEQVDVDVLDSVKEEDSATAEVFNTLDESANKLENWVAKNQKYIFGVVGAIGLAAAVYLVYDKFIVEPKENEAANEMFQAQQYFQQAVDGQTANDSLYNLALKGGEGKLGFIGIADSYSGTKAANLAHYYAGMAYLNTGKFKEAVEQLEQFKSDDMFLKAISIGAIGDAYSELGQKENALSQYQKAADANVNEFTTPRYLYKAGQLSLEMGKKAEALKFFTQIKEKYETSQEGATIDAMIAMVE